MKPENQAGETNLSGQASTNPEFALGQLARAFTTNQTHADADTRERAAGKIASWIKVLEGMLSGALAIGSRTPIANTPAWATLESGQEKAAMFADLG
jgi:hypothetical protein